MNLAVGVCFRESFLQLGKEHEDMRKFKCLIVGRILVDEIFIILTGVVRLNPCNKKNRRKMNFTWLRVAFQILMSALPESKRRVNQALCIAAQGNSAKLFNGIWWQTIAYASFFLWNIILAKVWIMD